MQIFWLDALAQRSGLQVTAGQGVDCFPLIWPNLTGWGFIVLGVASTILIHYLIVCLIFKLLNGFKTRPITHV